MEISLKFQLLLKRTINSFPIGVHKQYPTSAFSFLVTNQELSWDAHDKGASAKSIFYLFYSQPISTEMLERKVKLPDKWRPAKVGGVKNFQVQTFIPSSSCYSALLRDGNVTIQSTSILLADICWKTSGAYLYKQWKQSKSVSEVFIDYIIVIFATKIYRADIIVS